MLAIKNFFIVFFIFFSIFSFQNLVLASELNLPISTINPDKYLFYSIKRLSEKVIILTKLSKDSKADYYQDLTLKRLAELKYVVEKNLLGEVEHSTQRLSYQIGVLTDYINTNKTDLAHKKQTNINFLPNYKNLLEFLRDHYPANSSYWMLVQHSINSLDLNVEKLK